MKKIIAYILGAIVALLGNIWAYAGSEILLEGFEDNINNVIPATDGGSRGANGNVKLTHFIRTDAEEIWVTQGQRALQIELLNNQKWWSVDFLVYLDQEATKELEAAWNGDPEAGLKPEARYVLKYDVTFPETGVVTWMNQAVNNDSEAAREWNTSGNNNAPVIVEIPLDLVGTDLSINDDGTATLRFIDNADWPDGNTPKFFIDNIRLVDQWATDNPPATIVIESFEDNIDAVTPQGGRITVEHYKAADSEDSNVTHGSKSLKVVLAQPEGYSTDWHLDLGNSETLKELLQLPLQERWRYILRFDTVFEERPPEGWGGGDWGYKFSTSFSLADTARTPSDHSTYSLNLALANLDPDSPRITFYGNGGYSGEVVAYFDNSANNPRNPNDPPIQVGFGPRFSNTICDLWLQVLTKPNLFREPSSCLLLSVNAWMNITNSRLPRRAVFTTLYPMQSQNPIIADFVKLANSAAGTFAGMSREARDGARDPQG